MTIFAVVGDCTTTTCVALASGWPILDDVVILEADPSGGSLAGWLDTPASPSLATIVATSGTDDHGPLIDTVRTMTHHSAAGVRFIALPVRSVPAHRALAEADAVVTALARSDQIVIADGGTLRTIDPVPTALLEASTVVIVHRQASASAAAGVVRIERLVEVVEYLGTIGRPIVMAIIGNSPFNPSDVAQFVDDAFPGVVTEWVPIADDPLSAAAIAGHAGISAKRMRRLPLMQSAAAAGARLRLLIPLALDLDGQRSP